MRARVNKKYGELRGRMIARGHTLRSWALARGYRPTTVYDAAKGNRAGVMAMRIKKELEAFVE